MLLTSPQTLKKESRATKLQALNDYIAAERQRMVNAGFREVYIGDNLLYACARCAALVVDWEKHREQCS